MSFWPLILRVVGFRRAQAVMMDRMRERLCRVDGWANTQLSAVVTANVSVGRWSVGLGVGLAERNYILFLPIN